MRKVMSRGWETVTYELRVGDQVAVIGRIEKLHEEAKRLTVAFGSHKFAVPDEADPRVEVSEDTILPIDSRFSPQNVPGTLAEPRHEERMHNINELLNTALTLPCMYAGATKDCNCASCKMVKTLRRLKEQERFA
jgi:hypothetical protein